MSADRHRASSVDRPTVSVVIPAWNGERFIEKTLLSVFAQTYTDLEIVVVDDGSTDGTREILERHADRLRCHRQENEGQSAARNRGAELARGALLAFLDHDDCWEPTYLEAIVACFEAQPRAGLVVPGYRFLDADDRPLARRRLKRSPGEWYTTCSLLEGDVGTIHNPVIRKDVFLASGGYDTTIHGPEDCELWLRLSFATEMLHLPEALLLYRTHADNASKNLLDNAREWLRVLDKFEREHPEFVASNRRLMDRNWSKQYGRLGRELLARKGEDRANRREARTALLQSIGREPLRVRSYIYAALTCLPGITRLYSSWRRRELEMHERSHDSSLLANLAQRRPGRHPWDRERADRDKPTQ